MDVVMKFFFLAVAAIAIQFASAHSSVPNHLLMPRSAGDASLHVSAHINCISWRLGVETNNIIGWRETPKECGYYVADYMTTGQYRKDCDAVAKAAVDYAKTLPVGEKDIWVFDIDETALSNLEYYAGPDVQYGAVGYKQEKFIEWIQKEQAKALPAVLALYKELIALKIEVVFLTAFSADYKAARERNLKAEGYDKYLEVIHRSDGEGGKTFKSKKREELEKKGYKIVGNMGDQWSDLVGSTPGKRTFKLPNPMYYV